MDIKVRRANREFYDLIADAYEEVDGRRNQALLTWLESTIKKLKDMTSGGVLLDLGCGSGVVLRTGSDYFQHTYGMDISPLILKGINSPTVCGEGERIPLKSDSVDVVVCFAVIHHIFDSSPVINEIYRVLKKNGVLYIDHDMDSAFMKRFYVPLKIYRSLFSAYRKYSKTKAEITKELYDLTEIHSEGVDSDLVLKQVQQAGFKQIESFYHWFGLNGLTNRLMKHRKFERGSAPLLSLLARK